MKEQCIQHQFEAAADLCRTCGYDYCTECLVYAFGHHQAPYCVACALTASGVRSNAARPTALSRREIKRRMKARDREINRKVPAVVEVKVNDFDWEPAAAAAQSPEWIDAQFPHAEARVPF